MYGYINHASSSNYWLAMLEAAQGILDQIQKEVGDFKARQRKGKQ